MRLTEDQDLSFCLTVSTGIDKDVLLAILGRSEDLPEPQTFDDFPEEAYVPGKKGLLNVFEDNGFLITLENTGYLGATRRTINKVAEVTVRTPGHYVAIYSSFKNFSECQYVEVQDGMVQANFDPNLDEIPELVAQFFSGQPVLSSMVNALEYRLETTVKPEWLESPTTTYVIDYRTDRV